MATDRVKVFISSTWIDLRREREFVAVECRRMGLEPLYYPESSIAGSNVREFIARVQESHVVIHLATRPSRFVEAELESAEALGIPVIELAERHPLDGGTGVRISDQAIERRARTQGFQRQFDTLDELSSAVRDGLSYVLARRFASILSVKAFGEDAYDKARLSIQAAHFRLATVQETSTLVLGPRHGRELSERRFLHELQRLIDSVLTGHREVQIVHVMDGNATRSGWDDTETYRESAESSAWLRSRLDDIEASERVAIAVSGGPLTATIVADASLEMSTVLGRRYYVWLSEVGGAAHDMWEIVRNLTLSPAISLRDYLDSLGT